ncbi:MAG: hypothetical protein K0S43_2510, partial [Cellulosimicrobium sp.]|nr:hypothetical protein [Cellulosimicrobium sp.]
GLDPVGTATARASLLAVVLGGLGVVGDRARVRAGVTSAVVLAPLVPLVAAPAAQAPWGWAVALLATACLTALAAPVAARSGARVGSTLRGEQALLGVVRTVALPLAVVVGLTVTAAPGLPTGSGSALVALGAALVSTLLRVATRERRWYAIGGATAVLAGALLGTGGDVAWLGFVPALAAATWLVVLVLTTPRLVTGVLGSPVPAAGRSDALLGGALVALVGAGPALAVAGVRAAEVLVTGTAGTAATLDDAPLGVGVFSAGLWGEGVRDGTAGAALLDGTIVGLLSALVVLLAAARLPLRTPVPVPFPRLAGSRRLGVAPVVRTGRALGPWVLLVLVVALVLDPRLAGVTSLTLLTLLAAVLLVATARPVATGAPAGGAAPGALVRAVRRGFGRAVRPIVRRLPGPRAAVRHGVVPVGRAEARVWHAAAVAGTIVAVVLLVAGSWVTRPTAAAGAVVAGALLLAARASAPRGLHAPLVGTAYAYALLVLGVTLAWSGAGTVAVLCAVSGVASLAALAVTLTPRVDRDSWWAVLGVTAVPFGLGVLTVVDERSWWSVAACVAMLALEVVLVGSRRPGSVTALRVLAAALVLPTAAVAVVSTGALVLPGSGSPVVLPVVALLVAAALAAARPLTARIHLTAGRVAVEASAAVTGAIAVGLAFGRPAAGPTVAVAVLLLLAVGAGLAARDRDRRAEWWLAAALGTAALWTALAAADVGLVEAYTAPPALVAVVTGALLARRSRRWWELAGAGLVLLVVPSVLVMGAAPGAGDVRAPVLVVAGAVTVLAAVVLGRGTGERGWRRAAALRLAGAGVLAATGGTVESLHVAHAPGGGAVFLLGFAWALAAGAVALGAGLVGAGPGRRSRAALGRGADRGPRRGGDRRERAAGVGRHRDGLARRGRAPGASGGRGAARGPRPARPPAGLVHVVARARRRDRRVVASRSRPARRRCPARRAATRVPWPVRATQVAATPPRPRADPRCARRRRSPGGPSGSPGRGGRSPRASSRCSARRSSRRTPTRARGAPSWSSCSRWLRCSSGRARTSRRRSCSASRCCRWRSSSCSCPSSARASPPGRGCSRSPRRAGCCSSSRRTTSAGSPRTTAPRPTCATSADTAHHPGRERT